MRVAVISCMKYRDAIDPCMKLLRKFWPNHPKTTIITDLAYMAEGELPYAWSPNGGLLSWCDTIVNYLRISDDSPVLLMQEDFFINAPVNQPLIDHALEQLKSRNAGMIRLYPCPGADEDYGDEHYGIVKKGSPYRISCQASIFRPDYLYAIASQCGSTPRDFELNGTKIAESLPDEVLAFKRHSGPWPIQYYCSAISAGKWNPQALEFCRQQGISVDLSLREIAY